MNSAQDQIGQRASMEMIQNGVHSCFEECITDFRQQAFVEKEASCLKNCGARFMGSQHEF